MVQKIPPKLRLKLANECDDLLARTKMLIRPNNNNQHKYHLVHSTQMNIIKFDRLMELFKSLMKEMYEKSSWGWNEEEKLAEWKHPRSKFIIVTKAEYCNNLDYNSPVILKQVPKDEEELIGFLCFRFEIGANKLECSLYVYELHVNNGYQRQGLGGELMKMVKTLALEFKMDKIMLTVFRSNLQALQFYKKLKFHQDTSSPAPNESDYVILSLKL